jgi:hypothetical protein
MLIVLVCAPIASASSRSSLTNGVPDDIIALGAFLPKSSDFGLYSQCELPRGSGQLSGVCVPPAYIETHATFCRDVVGYPACVPPANPIWPSWNTSAKDALVERLFTELVDTRTAREQRSLNGTSDEYLQMRFVGNPKCVDDFKKIICYYNFPQCEYFGSVGSTGNSQTLTFAKAISGPTIDLSGSISQTYPLCYERCSEYFNQCKFPSGMVDEFCQTGSSVWPMLAEDIGSLTVSAMESESVTNCTGKGVKENLQVASSIFLIILVFVIIS